MKSLLNLDFFFGIFGNKDGPNIKNDASNRDEYYGNNTARSSIQTDLIDIIGYHRIPLIDIIGYHRTFIFQSYRSKKFKYSEHCPNNRKNDDYNCQTNVNQHGFSITGVGTKG